MPAVFGKGVYGRSEYGLASQKRHLKSLFATSQTVGVSRSLPFPTSQTVGVSRTLLSDVLTQVGISRTILSGASVQTGVSRTLTFYTSEQVGVTRNFQGFSNILIGVQRTDLSTMEISAGIMFGDSTFYIGSADFKHVRQDDTLYRIVLFDSNGAILDVLENISAPVYRKQFSIASPVDFAFPAGDRKRAELTMAREMGLFRGKTEVAHGKITRRDFAMNPLRISALSAEIFLEEMQTPADWGNVYEGKDVGVVIRDLLKGFNSLTINTRDDYDVTGYAVDSSNVDIDAVANQIWLNYESGSDPDTLLPTRTFVESGYITFQFDMGTHNGYERIRWGQQVGTEVHVKVSFRTSSDGETWGSWSVPTENLIAPEKMGLDLDVLGRNLDRYIQVKVDLSTDDTVTPLYSSWADAQENGVQIYGFSPIFAGLEIITRTAGKVQLEPTTPDEFGILVRGLNVSTQNHLSVLVDLAEQYGLEFYVDTSLYLHVLKAPGSPAAFDPDVNLGNDYSDRVLMVNHSDMQVDTLEDDDSDLVNVLYCRGAGSGPSQLSLPKPLRDEDSIADYGERPGTFTDTSITDRATLETKGLAHLTDKSRPRQSFRVTTYPRPDWPRLNVGDLVSVADPDSALLTTARIMDIQTTVNDQGELLKIGLNTRLRTLLDRFNETEAKFRKGEAAQAVAPSPPGQFRAQLFQGYAVLSWIGYGSRYILQHATAKNGPWTNVETNLTATKYTHENIDMGVQNWYRVAQVSGTLQSAFTEARLAAFDTTPPAVPTGLSVSSYIRGLIVTLAANTEVDWDGFEIHVSTESGFMPDSTTKKAQGRTTRFTVADLIADTTYYVKAVAYDISGNRSAPTDEVSGVAGKATSGDIESVDATTIIEGELDVGKVKIVSQDGKMYLRDNLLIVQDSNNVVRVRIGKLS